MLTKGIITRAIAIAAIAVVVVQTKICPLIASYEIDDFIK